MKSIERRNGYLYLEYAEPYTFENFITISKQVFETCKAEQYQKVLVNVSEMTPKA